MLKIREAIVVEGRYDKNTLSQVVDTLILETAGFGIFRDPERMALLRRAAERRGLIVLTDSDGAGFVIRNRIKGSIPGQYLKHPQLAFLSPLPLALFFSVAVRNIGVLQILSRNGSLNTVPNDKSRPI